MINIANMIIVYLFFMSNIEIYKSHFKNDHAKTFWMKIFEIL